jgi:Methyltransferase domain
MLRRLRSLAAVAALPPYVKPGHFYSPLSGPADAAREMTRRTAPGVDLREAAQLDLAAQLAPVLQEPPSGPRYREANDMLGPADAAVYRAVLRHFRPARIIEAGSGWSTALALDERDRGLPLGITCIEPYPARLESLLLPGDRVRLLREGAQDVPQGVFGELAAGDVLFIDSSHVAKAGSDVTWLMLHVLPLLAAGVIVHVHDVFWPFTYPRRWLEERRDWNEAYLLHAFLTGNSQWEILLWPSWLWRNHPTAVPGRLAKDEPGSIWLRKTGPS